MLVASVIWSIQRERLYHWVTNNVVLIEETRVVQVESIWLTELNLRHKTSTDATEVLMG